MFDPSRADVRRFFCETWRKHRERIPLEPLEALALDWIVEHPEYHGLLAAPEEAIAADYAVESGRTNPFLHLSMHLAVAEQLQIDQPPGIRDAWQRLLRRTGSPHEAAHAVMDCLAEVIWRAQRDGTAPDGAAYLECLARRASGR
ncbi:MAG: DUF1841 family protein [Burkholderiales bacterium]|nr:DUF1841 family protein [Burkholderiales bacterium]OJX04396.1 MAG: hypothetical protein BGO72_17570 [Burkholderiales bacterium 70-64]